MEIKKITAPLDKEVIKTLNKLDKVLITGYIYMARDAAHKKMVEALDRGEKKWYNERKILF